MFYGIDGDKMGRLIEALFIQNELNTLSDFSNKIIAAVEEIREFVVRNKGTIIFHGGDSILFEGQFDNEQCGHMLSRFVALTGHTASMGIGRSATEAYLALKLAKAEGGGKIVHYKFK
jgi:hypothetical protein